MKRHADNKPSTFRLPAQAGERCWVNNRVTASVTVIPHCLRCGYSFIIIGVGVIAAGIIWLLVIVQDSAILVVREEEADEETVESAKIELVPRTVVFNDGTEATFRLASAFNVSVAAENLGKARFMAMSSDGRMFVPDMVDYNLSHEGRIIILDDFDEKTHRFKSKSTYLSGLRGPNSVVFYTDNNGRDWIYIALTEQLIRYPYRAGDTAPSAEPEVIAEFPNTQSSTAIGVVWHITRTILFHDDTLYVSVGSGCNACEQPEGEMRAMIIAMDPDGKNARIYARGLRNAVGLAWAADALYVTENGVDHLGPAVPDDVMYKITEGGNYGWPHCYESGGKKLKDDSLYWKDEPASCKDASLSFAAFAPHSAPLGLAYFEDIHSSLNGSFLVALHGSHELEIGNGYQLVRVSKDGEKDIFMDGFLNGEGERLGRPVHILQKDENSFFVTDDYKGKMYYLYALP